MPCIKYTEVITKIILRNDIINNWEASTLILEKGEPALVLNPRTKLCKLKFGDGKRTFSELPYSTATPDEIRNTIRTCINSILLAPGTEKGTIKISLDGMEYDNIAVTGLKSAAYTEASDYATAKQGERADLAMVYCGHTDKLPEVTVIGDTYVVSKAFIIPGDVSSTGLSQLVHSGDKITVTRDDKWEVINVGYADVAGTLASGITAKLTGGAVGGCDDIINAGDTMEIYVREINTDYLVQGEKTIIFNCGTSRELV